MLETLGMPLQHAGLFIVQETYIGDFNPTTRGSADMASFASRPSQSQLFGSVPRQGGNAQFANNLLRPQTFNRFS